MIEWISQETLFTYTTLLRPLSKFFIQATFGEYLRVSYETRSKALKMCNVVASDSSNPPPTELERCITYISRLPDLRICRKRYQELWLRWQFSRDMKICWFMHPTITLETQVRQYDYRMASLFWPLAVCSKFCRYLGVHMFDTIDRIIVRLTFAQKGENSGLWQRKCHFCADFYLQA